jgi:hypothetical protein
VILSITNRCETDIAVSLSSIETIEQANNLSGFEPSASLTFDKNNVEIVIDRQENAKSVATLKPSDSETNGLVCFRCDNKVGIRCYVTPSSASGKAEVAATEVPAAVTTVGHVKCVFNLRCVLNIKDNTPIQTPSGVNQSPMPTSPASVTTGSTPVSSPTLLATPSVSTVPVVYQVFVDFGALNIDEGSQVIPKPQYVDDCFILTSK